jgi:peptidylprolyl isomerase
MKRMRHLIAWALVIGTVLLSGCGNSESSPTAGEEAVSTSRTPAADWTTLEEVAGDEADRLILPSGPPPQKMVKKDLRAGKGPAIKPKQEFGVRYIALEYDSGVVRQEVWRPSFHAAYRADELVDAFEVGLDGMRVGGLRELIAPSSLAYGDGALVYLIKLIELGKVND